jgi:hypothetical protein
VKFLFRHQFVFVQVTSERPQNKQVMSQLRWGMSVRTARDPHAGNSTTRSAALGGSGP